MKTFLSMRVEAWSGRR